MRVLGEDLVRVYGDRYDKFTKQTKSNVVTKVYYWGDEIDLVNPDEADDPAVKEVQVRVYHPGLGKYQIDVIQKKRDPGCTKNKRYLPIKWRSGDNKYLLETTVIDVQQGDATLIRTPDRKVILLDGGEGKFVARILAAAFPGSTADKPFVIDALVVTHGDADHFSGLAELANAAQNKKPRKRIHARVARYFHNGLVKRGGDIIENGRKRRRNEKEKLGQYLEINGKTYVMDVFADPREATEINEPFKEWNKALEKLLDPAGLTNVKRLANEQLPRVERLQFGDDDKFAIFSTDGIKINVLGPIVDSVNGVPALEFLRDRDGGISSSHTINGHSVVLKLCYGNVNFMLGGDLNIQAEERLREYVNRTDGLKLTSEVLKVPHHGSHEFDPDFLGEIKPVISIVSSGDENTMKEYIHPRANLMAALGRYSRGPAPLVFSTELAAFFAYRGPIQPESHKKSGNELVDIPKSDQRGCIHAFERLVFGAVRVRTDGKRILVAVESANDGVKEAYAFDVSDSGQITQTEVSML